MIKGLKFIKERGIFLLFLFSFLIIADNVISQPRGVLVVTGRVEKENRPLPDANIRVYHENELIDELKSNIIGRFEFYLQYDNEYVVEFTADGMVTKSMDFTTHMPKSISRRAFHEFDFVVELFPEIEEVDLSFLEESLATISFDEEESFEFYFPEEEFAENLARAIDLQDRVYSYIRRTERYEFLINRADNRFDNEEYIDALSDYNEATGFFPQEEHPLERINEINEILAQLEDVQERYQRLITQADEYYSIEVYESAIEYYQQASLVKPEEEYPPNQIEQIQLLMAQQIVDADGQAERDSIMRAETLAREEYDSLIVVADGYFEQDDYNQARNVYLNATELLPDEQYPRDMLSTIGRILRGEREEANLYAQTVEKADSLFNRQRYELAKLEYNEAYDLRPEDPYPVEQIEIIDGLIAEIQLIDEEYQNLIIEADDFFQNREYAAAGGLYENALELKPNEDYPSRQLDEISTILSRRERDLQAYNDAIRQADRFFNQENYAQALEEYKKALNIRGGDDYSESKISELEQILASSRSESLSYQQNIEQGDQLFNQRRLVEARDAYYRALSIVQGSEYPTERINEINELIVQGEEMDAFYEEGFMEVSGVSEVIENGTENRYQIVPFSRRRTGSYIETKVKNESDNNIRLFVNYGVGLGRSGGIAVVVPPVDDTYELRINVSSQSSWISYDNTWISFAPVGGALEVESINIVFGD